MRRETNSELSPNIKPFRLTGFRRFSYPLDITAKITAREPNPMEKISVLMEKTAIIPNTKDSTEKIFNFTTFIWGPPVWSI